MNKIILVISLGICALFFLAISLSLFLTNAASLDIYALSSFELDFYRYGQLLINIFPYLKGNEYFVSYVSACIGIVCCVMSMRVLGK